MAKYLLGFLVVTVILSCRQSERLHVTGRVNMDRDSLAMQMERSLREETLQIWYPMSQDREHDGFLSTYTYDWKPYGSQDKMIVTQARHTWVNARAFQRYPEAKHYYDGAQRGFRFLHHHMWDSVYGGFFTLVHRDGKVADADKTAYGNAFAIYALAAVYDATADTAALDLAKRTFWWLEEHSHDSVNGGYYQHLQRNGEVIRRSGTTNSRADTGYKDQNSSIHLLEAFSELYSVWPDSLLRVRLEEMLKLIREVITTDKGYMTLFFTPEWRPVSFRDSSRTFIEEHHHLDHVSFGHDIETAYLMLEASEVLGRPNDSVTLQVAKRMVDHALLNGFDTISGGFFDEGYYFSDESSITILRDTKNWWAQAEGMHTLLMMYELFPDDSMKYGEKFLKQWRYIDEYLIDHHHGDWYSGGLDKQPDLKTALKGHQWKSTYHHFRALARTIERLRED